MINLSVIFLANGVIKLRSISIINPENIRRGQEQVKAAICYIFKEGKALMIKRKKEPFTGYIVAPGGKFEDGETPFQCIEREILEETGLAIRDYRLKIVTSELGPVHYNWILYIFVCNGYEGTVIESDEGKLVWVPVKELPFMQMSDIDRDMLPYVLDDNRYFMKLRYDNDKKCTIESIQRFNQDYMVE